MTLSVSPLKLREARHKAGMTQAELARRVGTSERNIVRWETGKNTPRLEHVAGIADATGRNIDFFVGDSSADAADEDDEEAASMAADLFNAILRVVNAKVTA